MPRSRLSHFNHLAEVQLQVYATAVGQIRKFDARIHAEYLRNSASLLSLIFCLLAAGMVP